MKSPKAIVAAPAPAAPVTWPTTGGSYIGNDLTGELIWVGPVAEAAADAPATQVEPKAEEQI